MRTTIYILTFLFSTTVLCGQTTNRQVKTDTIVYRSKECEDCPLITDTAIYQLLKCGLYHGSNGDLGYRTEKIYNDKFDRRASYINWVWGEDQSDTVNGGRKEMKYVIDTASFQFLNCLYWVDKDNVYIFTPTSDGGRILLNALIDRKSFEVIEGTDYAKDKKNIYYRSSIIEGADLETFRSINQKDLSELACDKFYFYQFGERLTEKEINDWRLENYRK